MQLIQHLFCLANHIFVIAFTYIIVFSLVTTRPPGVEGGDSSSLVGPIVGGVIGGVIGGIIAAIIIIVVIILIIYCVHK